RPARRAGSRGRRGRRRARRRGLGVGARRIGSRRLHRVRRQHRLRYAGADPGRRDALVPVPPQPLVLRVLRFAQGRSQPVTLADVQEFLYVVSGAGSLHLAAEEHALEPDTAALLLPGDTYELETDTGIE